MLSKKSYLADERNFLAPLVRPTRGDVRDHIDSHKSDRRSSYLSYRGLQRRKQRKTDLREMRPYRYYRQRRNTVMVRAPKRFLDQVLWPEFSELDQALQAYLHQVTLRVIREEVYADASEAQEVSEALRPN